jgi:transposase
MTTTTTCDPRNPHGPGGPRCIGLDVHKREATLCLLDAEGRELLMRRFDLTRHSLAALARSLLRPTDRVALEATTNSWEVAKILRPFVAEVVVSNPLATKAIASAKVKTDKVDARVLAQLLRCDYLPRVWEPDAATQQLRQLTGRRAALVQQRTGLRNRIHSVLAMRLIPEPAALFSPSGLTWLRSLFAGGTGAGDTTSNQESLDAEGKLLIDSDLVLLESLQQQIDRLDQVLAARGFGDERVKLLMTLPGVDVTTAESLLAALGDISRFPTPEKAAAYLGLVPSTRQSASKCYHGPITKRGNNQARWMLIQAAQSVARHPGPLGHFFRRLKRRKNHNVAVVAVARKLVMIAWQMLTTGEPYRYAQPRATETKLARLRIKATGQRRRTGPKQGERCVAKLPEVPGGSRTVRALDDVYQTEGVPRRTPLTPGEQRTVAATDTAEFVTSLDRQQVIPRRRQRQDQQSDESPQSPSTETSSPVT